MRGGPAEYVCDLCGKRWPRADRDMVAAKVAQFRDIGEGGKVIKSRTVGWLCKQPCMENDPQYQLPSMGASPGFRGTKIAVDWDDA